MRQTCIVLWAVALCVKVLAAEPTEPTAATLSRLTKERIVFQTTHGDIEMALYPEVSQSARHSLLGLIGSCPELSFTHSNA